MWHNNKTVTRTHCKAGSQQAWAIVQDVDPNWLRVKTGSADGVTNIYMILNIALSNSRKVDVFVDGGMISQATLI